MAKGKESQKLIANNKKAYHDFFIDETYECGIALHGTEVKSMRMGKCSIKEAFVRIEDGEVRDQQTAGQDQGKRVYISPFAGIL